MPTPRKYPPELKSRAVRLVLEAQKADETLTLNAAAVRIIASANRTGGRPVRERDLTVVLAA